MIDRDKASLDVLWLHWAARKPLFKPFNRFKPFKSLKAFMTENIFPVPTV
jgi:hypothetical protein